MIKFIASENDCPEWIHEIYALTSAIIEENKPTEVYLIKIDNWFDSKWLKFTGKVLGALGVWDYNKNTKIPPFNPNRVISEKRYLCDSLGNYNEADSLFIIHKIQASEDNKRKIITLSDNAIYIWYSSNSLTNNFGSYMLYKTTDGNCSGFYLGFEKEKSWQIINNAGTNKKLMTYIIDKGKQLIKK